MDWKRSFRDQLDEDEKFDIEVTLVVRWHARKGRRKQLGIVLRFLVF